VHTICDYRHPCDKQGTNLERLNSIRGLLGRTKTLLDDLQIEYAIYGGSAIGQERCGDVLPWDKDCDVVVWEEDVHKITEGDLDSQYTVMHKSFENYGVPYAVADKKTGFYCDIFFMKSNAETHHVEFAWPWGRDVCNDMSTSWPFSADIKRCNRYPAHIVAPFAPCTLNGVQHTCMKDQLAYLNLEYGPGVTKPNLAINSVGRAQPNATRQLAAKTKKGSWMRQGPYSLPEHWQNLTVLCITMLLLIFAGIFATNRSGGQWNNVYMATYLIFGVCEYLLARSVSIQHNGLPFYGPCGVVAIEALKLLVTLGLVAWTGSWQGFGKVTSSDALQLSVPAFMYFGQNTFFYIAISWVVLATYAITFELQIIVVAALALVVFGRTLNRSQAAACVGVCIGAAIHRMGKHEMGASLGELLPPICMAVWVATSTIVSEYVLKAGNHLDVNVQNTYMCAFSIVLGMVGSWVMKWHLGLHWMELLVGLHHPQVIVLLTLRALFGIACSRILKYMDSLSKTIASALCAPLALGLAPLAIDEHVDSFTLVAIFITYIASLVYWTNPGACASEKPSKGVADPEC
jgi:drug/metabolite transporter (DMT)-like permease